MAQRRSRSVLLSLPVWVRSGWRTLEGGPRSTMISSQEIAARSAYARAKPG
ncbi:MAG TPA: hypothetical protein VM512_02970 [Burkholderiaceae bacterium]|nr:hypothetical protein [Burkholderiaceae bacterium]